MFKHSGTKLFVWLFIVLIVRIIFLGLFQKQVFQGPSTLYDQSYVAINILEGHGLKTFISPPQGTDPLQPSKRIDPEHYPPAPEVLIPYTKDVTGYAFFLAFLWLFSGAKLWIYAQIVQILLDVVVALGLFVLTKKHLGFKAAILSVFVFSILFFEARASVVPYKDIFNLYVMLAIALLGSRIYFQEGKKVLWFACICILTGLGYHFMPSIALYPVFFIVFLLILKRISLKAGLSFILIAAVVVGLSVYPYRAYVQKHKDNPQVAQPYFWYRFWLGTKIEAFYSTQEERFEDYFKDKTVPTGLTLEEICKLEFFDYVKRHPFKYALQTGKKLLFGMFLVYANAGDCTEEKSWSTFRSQNPQAGFTDYARTYPLRIFGMVVGTLSISLLFPLSLAAAFLLVREKKWIIALFFLHIPAYFLLLHMFFHYEARYLLGTLPGYLPLAGYLLSRLSLSKRASKKRIQA